MKKARTSRILLVLTFLFVAADSLFFGKGISKILQLKRNLKNIDSRIEIIKKENTELKTSIEKLRSDPLTIETIAREELGMARSGETIYQLPMERKRKE